MINKKRLALKLHIKTLKSCIQYFENKGNQEKVQELKNELELAENKLKSTAP